MHLTVKSLELQHVLPVTCSKTQSPMVQHIMNGSTSPGASDAQSFLETIFSSPDLGVLSLEVKCKRFCDHYTNLQQEEKLQLLKVLSRHYGVNQDSVVNVSRSVVGAQERGEASLLMTEERLRHALIPQYQQLFSKIGRIEGGVKFLVDMRADVLTNLTQIVCERERAELRALQMTIRDLLALWFSVGFLQLQRITWTSPCDMVQKISAYEAVHPIRDWTDLKRRVGPYRRCFVFTHGSMPREPVVVLHTALTPDISSNIHSILRTPSFSGSRVESSTPEENCPDEKEDERKISAAIFYSITSTQKGLQGVDLGNYLIKTVVKELQSEFPDINQFSSLSPIPGFKSWLVTEINKEIHARDNGEIPVTRLLQDNEIQRLKESYPCDSDGVKTLKQILESHSWVQKEHLCVALKGTLLRLCARYLYHEKRRGYALNPVANFHIGNGAVMWRLNWMADMSMRGINQSCGLMVNYRYYLENTEENSRKYFENHQITASTEFLEILEEANPTV